MGISGKRPVRVLIADHHQALREGLQAVLKQARSAQGFDIAVAETADDAIDMLRAKSHDVVILVYDIPPRGGPKAGEMILRRNPGVKLIGLMLTAEAGPVSQMLTAGADGCILMNIGADTLVEAIRTILNGRPYFSNDIYLELNKQRTDHGGTMLRITKRERQILELIIAGLKNREIAEKLGISKRTVDKHRQRLNAKLGVRNQAGLGVAAQRLGIIDGVPASHGYKYVDRHTR